MYREEDSSSLMDMIFGHKPSKGYRKYETIVKRITRIKTLVENDQLLQKIVNFAKERYCKDNHKPLTLADAKNPDRHGLMYYRVDKNTESGYGEVWSTSRWEGDYCEPYLARYDMVSFTEIIDDYVEEYPNEVQWKVEEKVEEVKEY